MLNWIKWNWNKSIKMSSIRDVWQSLLTPNMCLSIKVDYIYVCFRKSKMKILIYVWLYLRIKPKFTFIWSGQNVMTEEARHTRHGVRLRKVAFALMSRNWTEHLFFSQRLKANSQIRYLCKAKLNCQLWVSSVY